MVTADLKKNYPMWDLRERDGGHGTSVAVIEDLIVGRERVGGLIVVECDRDGRRGH